MKKKLLMVQGSSQWNRTLEKFLKLQKRISAPGFESHSRSDRSRLINKLKSLFARLESMQYKVGIRLAGSVIALMFVAATVNAQEGTWSVPDSLELEINGSFSLPQFADLDEDGDMDLYVGIAGDDAGKIRVFKNDGYGEFPDPPTNLQADGEDLDLGGYAWLLSFIDIDNDGDMDFIGSEGYGVQYVYINQGLGLLSKSGVLKTAEGDTLNVENSLQSIAWLDLDGDGDEDLIAGTNNQYKINTFTNNGDMTFSRGNDFQADGDTLWTDKRQYMSIAFADVDLDGDKDLFIGHGGEAPHVVKYYKNNGGVFSAQVDSIRLDNGEPLLSPNSSYVRIAFADLDDDGVEELYMGGIGGGVSVTHYTASVGIRETAYKKELGLYPIPAGDLIRFEAAGMMTSVRIYSMTGSLVAEYRNVFGSVDVSDLKTGMYLLIAAGTEQTYKQKFIKE